MSKLRTMQMLLNTLLEIVRYTVPSVIVFLLMDRFLRLYLLQQQPHLNTRPTDNDPTLPTRLQAYERMALLCERTSIESLLLRIPPADMRAQEYEIVLLLAIQKEYEHNIAQQIYVSATLWNILRAAREDSIALIQHARAQIGADGSAVELVQAIQYLQTQRGRSAQYTALDAVRQETSQLFG
ncbi:MAG: hypothetical protein ACKOAY_05720 [Haliscomenobacter sp.]